VGRGRTNGVRALSGLAMKVKLGSSKDQGKVGYAGKRDQRQGKSELKTSKQIVQS